MLKGEASMDMVESCRSWTMPDFDLEKMPLAVNISFPCSGSFH